MHLCTRQRRAREAQLALRLITTTLPTLLTMQPMERMSLLAASHWIPKIQYLWEITSKPRRETLTWGIAWITLCLPVAKFKVMTDRKMQCSYHKLPATCTPKNPNHHLKSSGKSSRTMCNKRALMDLRKTEESAKPQRLWTLLHKAASRASPTSSLGSTRLANRCHQLKPITPLMIR